MIDKKLLELECLLLDTKDAAIVSKWWDSGMAALDEYQELQPGAAESALSEVRKAEREHFAVVPKGEK